MTLAITSRRIIRYSIYPGDWHAFTIAGPIIHVGGGPALEPKKVSFWVESSSSVNHRNLSVKAFLDGEGIPTSAVYLGTSVVDCVAYHLYEQPLDIFKQWCG